jgi:hypothetical protein
MSTLPSQDILSKPSLAALSFLLRNRETWPDGFAWDYSDCSTCAMGLAFRLGMVARPFTGAMEDSFKISQEAANNFFVFATRHYSLDSMIEVTPEHVADLIDAHLAAQ